MSLGNMIDAQGVTASVEDGDLIAGVVVLLKVVQTDGCVRMSLAWSDGMSWLERVGMLRVAEISEREDSQ